MPTSSADSWSARLRQTLGQYGEPLLRRVAARLIKPRSHWPRDELVERCAAAVENAPVIDRRLPDLDAGCRALLGAIGCSRQARWTFGNLVELAITLGQADAVQTVLGLLETGFLCPLLSSSIKSFEAWLGHAAGGLWVFAPPLVAARARHDALALVDVPPAVEAAGAPVESDGLEWPLRLAVLWQRIGGAPLRRTQNGDFFKRDVDRLEN